jgi:outer membrane protein OmpA-like peptidoglycan-associated protein
MATMRERTSFERELSLLKESELSPTIDSENARGQSPAECERRWKKFRTDLPDQVRSALDKLDYELAVLAAIHHGLRSVEELTNLIFFTQYGNVHGFCPVKRGRRVPNGGELYSKLWTELRDKYVRPALARPSPPLAQKGGVSCLRRENRRDDWRPEAPSADSTGHYEPVVAAGSTPDFVFRVNQAGKHVECLFRHISVPSRPGSGEAFRLHGDLQSDGSFYLFRKNDPKYLGHFAPMPAGTATLTLNGKNVALRRVADRPTLLSAETLDPLVKLYEQFPLASAQLEHLSTAFAADKVAPFLAKYFDQPGGSNRSEKLDRGQAAGRFDSYVKQVFDHPRLGISRKRPGDQRLARFYVHTQLTENRWTKTYQRSQLEWIQFMYNRTVREGGTLPYLADYLALQMAPEGGPHTYAVELKLTGGGIFVHGYKGTLSITKTSAGGRWPKGKVENYSCAFIAFEAGAGVKLGDAIEGNATSEFEWQPPDLPGSARMAAAEAGVSGGPLEVTVEGGFLHLYGAGYLPPLTVLFKDISAKIDPDSKDKRKPKGKRKGKGFGFSLGPSGAFGTIHSKAFPDIDYTTIQAKTDYSVAYALMNDVHFCLDSAVLTEDARQALRIVCALELPAFASEMSHLSVIGHTDRSAGDIYNLGLSDNRAHNTVRAIRDILGSKFGIPETKVWVQGAGEELARREKLPDKQVDPRYRRVDVILNARLILSLRGA